MILFWSGLFQAGAVLASGLLSQQANEDKMDFEAQQNAANNQAAMDRLNQQLAFNRESLAAELSMSGANLALQKEMQKKALIADALSEQGKMQGEALIRDQQSYANRPERFQSAINTLVTSLK